jgi:glycerol-3-phosphate dehydrogenase
MLLCRGGLLAAKAAAVAGTGCWATWQWTTAGGPSSIASCKAPAHAPPVVDVVVIGGGVVGLAVAQQCAVRGRSVVLVEREPWLASGASAGNSGIGCTGYDAPVGSLERKLLRRAVQLHPNLYRSFGLSYDHVRKCGSLVVAWTAEELAKLPAVLAENREAGDTEACLLSQEELRETEPCLREGALGAVLCPREAIVEPWLVPQGYAESARRHGATLLTGLSVTGAQAEAGSGTWELVLAPSTHRASAGPSPGRSRDGELLTARQDEWQDSAAAAQGASTPGEQQPRSLRARVVVNCGGLHGDGVEQMRLRQCVSTGFPESAPFQVTPRKGQFLVLKPKPGDVGAELMPSYVIEPVASQFTKGVIAFTSAYGNLIIGPTAVPQQDKEDRSTDAKTLAALLQHGAHTLRGLDDCTAEAGTRQRDDAAVPRSTAHYEVLGSYSGLRPATEHRDYQIASHPSGDGSGGWVTVGGIRSTGLTASPAIGEYVAETLVAPLLEQHPRQSSKHAGSAPSAADGLTGVTVAAANPLPLYPSTRTNPAVPPLRELAEEYRRRGDGCVTLYGRAVRVTHPLASFGMESRTDDGTATS